MFYGIEKAGFNFVEQQRKKIERAGHSDLIKWADITEESLVKTFIAFQSQNKMKKIKIGRVLGRNQ